MRTHRLTKLFAMWNSSDNSVVHSRSRDSIIQDSAGTFNDVGSESRTREKSRLRIAIVCQIASVRVPVKQRDVTTPRFTLGNGSEKRVSFWVTDAKLHRLHRTLQRVDK